MILRATLTLLALLFAPAPVPVASTPASPTCEQLITLAAHATCHSAEARVAPALALLASLDAPARTTCLATLATTPADDRGLIHVVLATAFADDPTLSAQFLASPHSALRASALDALARMSLPRAEIRALTAPHLLDPSSAVRARARLALRSTR